MSALSNYFCQIYENVDIMFIEIYRIRDELGTGNTRHFRKSIVNDESDEL
jgi:hypothetical protein